MSGVISANTDESGFNLKVVAFDNIQTMRKALTDERERTNALSDDPFVSMYSSGGSLAAIEPPFDLFSLSVMPENSSQLAPIIDAMEVNIERLGYRIVPRDGIPSEETNWSLSMKRERYILRNFFANAVLEPTMTFTSMRGAIRRDLETTGNGYTEVLENLTTGKPAGLNHLPSWTMRLTKEDEQFTDCIVLRSVQNENGEWTIEPFPYAKKFRRFVQISSTTGKAVYFKEWNDPRVISRESGEVIKNGSPNDPLAAHAVIHFKLYCTRSPYGLPRWVGSLMPIIGNRSAETINYTTFRNNNIPALMMLATNVNITDASIGRIREFIEQQISGKANYSQILLVEAEPMGEGMRDPGTMKLEIKELTQAQHTDAMFRNYMEYNDNKIRRSFRIPPLLLGDSTDYTRSVADTSKRVAEEQMFMPERDLNDTIWNQTIVPALGVASMILKSNTPNVTDNYELTQLLSTAERSGGLSPYISRIVVEDVLGRSLPPLSSDIPADVPFTMTMLQKQLDADLAVAEAGGKNVATEKSWTKDDIRKQLEVVIDLAKGIPNAPPALVPALESVVNSI